MTQAVNKRKAKHPRALLPVEYLSIVVDMVCIDSSIESADNYDGVKWAQDEDYDPGTDISYMMTTDAGSMEQRMATSAFLHGRSYE